jgi:signal transduction histidine kinase
VCVYVYVCMYLCVQTFFYFRVSDNGKGMSPDAIENVFVAYAGSKLFNREQTGTGLGLCLLQKLCRAMQGDCAIDTEVDKTQVRASVLCM